MKNSRVSAANRREFLKSAGVLVAAAACTPGTETRRSTGGVQISATRSADFNGPQLAALGETVLPASLGAQGQREAVAAFVAWCDGYDPVAEEMHGYGYADVRYLPSDPVPAWRAQLDGLDVLSQRVHHSAFTQLTIADRQSIVARATRGARGDRLPSPLAASHIAIALLAHWASSPAAWDLALGATVSPARCRPLHEATRKPLPLAPTTERT